jgi:hypothetical protein
MAPSAALVRAGFPSPIVPGYAHSWCNPPRDSLGLGTLDLYVLASHTNFRTRELTGMSRIGDQMVQPVTRPMPTYETVTFRVDRAPHPRLHLSLSTHACLSKC